ncbi:MAG: hypothetical protein JO102_07435 [Elusimicrobia bacterium]|nr:hypothetical protein [Elusimicrobiota bacterium]
MNRFFTLAVAATLFSPLVGCKKAESPAPMTTAPAPKVITPSDLTAMADAVPKTGPREGNKYKVFMLVLRAHAQSGVKGVKVDMSVKGVSPQPETKVTDESGLATWDDLPFPDMKHQLIGVVHYYKPGSKEDEAREIRYPYIESDAYRLKDTQDIPDNATADPAP